MVQKSTYTLKHRRRRKGRTNYKKRLKLLLSNKPRIILRKQSKQIVLQLADFSANGDRIIITTTSNQLKKYGWKYSYKSLPASYLTGILFAKALQKKLGMIGANKGTNKKIIEAIPDTGLHPNTKGSKIYAAIKGIQDGGITVSCSNEVLPSNERITGKHILDYSKKITMHAGSEQPGKQSGDKKEGGQQSRQFSKTKVNNIQEDFEQIKKKILAI